MKNGKIIDAYRSRLRKIRKYHLNLGHHFKKEDLHRFRVEIKKLRAFIRLINTHPEHHQKIPKPVKKFYTRAGDIRNLQLYQQMISKLCNDLQLIIPAGYLNKLHNEERSKKKKARKLVGRISFGDFERQLEEHSPKELTMETETTFIMNNRSRLIGLIALPCYFDDTLHDIRKILKDLMYDHKFVDAAESVLPPFELNEPQMVKTLTSVLGDYHDLCLAFLLLKRACLLNDSLSEEKETIDELAIHLGWRKGIMKAEIMNLLKPPMKIEDNKAKRS